MGLRKIMVVEDESISLVLMERFLVAQGYSVVTTQDGSTAGKPPAMKEKPDLIILDLGLPGADPFGPQFDGFIFIDWLHRMAAETRAPDHCDHGSNRRGGAKAGA